MLYRLCFGPHQLFDKAGEGKDGGGGGSGSSKSKNKGSEDSEGEDDPGDVDDEETDGDEDSKEVDEGKGKVKLSEADKDKLIEKLRKENAKVRTSKKTAVESNEKLKKALIEAGLIQDDEEAPEEKIKGLSNQNGSLALENGILTAAVEHGIPKDGLNYFKFLVNEKAMSLGDDEELSEEDLESIAEEVRAKSGGTRSKSSVDGGKKAPNGDKDKGGTNDMSVQRFVEMSMSEKSELYQKNPDKYTSLMAQARKQKLLK